MISWLIGPAQTFHLHKCIHFLVSKRKMLSKYVHPCRYHTQLHFGLCYPLFFNAQNSIIFTMNSNLSTDLKLKQKLIYSDLVVPVAFDSTYLSPLHRKFTHSYIRSHSQAHSNPARIHTTISICMR